MFFYQKLWYNQNKNVGDDILEKLKGMLKGLENKVNKLTNQDIVNIAERVKKQVKN